MKPPVFWSTLLTRYHDRLPSTRLRRNRLVTPFAVVSTATTEVDRAMQAVETGFLQIGSILENTVTIEQKLVAQSRRMVELAEEKGGGKEIIDQAVPLIWNGLEFAASSDTKVVDLIERLAETTRQIQQTLPAQQTLTDALTPLKYVQVLFRIESATLPEDDQRTFLALNAEITRICERVETGFREKFELIASIGQRLEAAGACLRKRQTATRQKLDALRTQLEISIGSIKADYAQQEARNTRMEVIAPQLKRDTSAVVMSLQAQDMLNQKLQHLHTILSAMDTAHRTMPADRIGGVRTLRFVEQTSRLVTAQLDVMKTELATAGSQVGGSLGRIVQAMEGLNQDFVVVKNEQANDLTIDGGIQNLIDALENVIELIRASNDLVTETYQTIEPIRSLSTHFTSFMRELTLDIHLIGLNAEVQSAHVAPGTGLEVVSARATDVSLTTCRLSDQLAADIDRITGGLSDTVDAFGLIREQTETFVGKLTHEAKQHEDQLHSYRDRMIDILLQIHDQLPLLEAQTRSAMNHADFAGTAVTQIEALHAAVTTLQTTATAAADAEGVTIDTTGMTDQFLKGYTMRSQVDVHQRAQAGQAAPAHAAGAAVAASAGSDVELFGFDDPLPTPPAASTGAAASTPGDIDLWGDEPVASAPAPNPPAVATPAMDVELWGDEPEVAPRSQQA